MANKKITDLQLISALTDSVNFPGDPGTQTYRTTASQIWDYIEAKIGTKRNALSGGTSGGAANVQTLTPTKPLTSYNAETVIFFMAGFTNTTAATMNVSGLGAKTIKTASGAALTGNEIVSGRVYGLVYDGTDFILVSGAPNAAARTVRANSTTSAAYPSDVALSTLKTMLYIPRSFQSMLSGSGTYYTEWAFVISATVTVAPTAGATYTHNSVTWTVLRTLTVGSFTVVYAWGAAGGTPTATGGTLTKSAGTGDSSIVFIEAHYPKSLRVRGVGAGGGGAGSGTAGLGSTTGGTGGTTTFGSSLLSANGGSGGLKYDIGGAGDGGAASITAPAFGIAQPGSGGNPGFDVAGGANHSGGSGGNSFFSGAGRGSTGGNTGITAQTNSGSGGGGGGGAGTTVYSGGGGSGGYFDATIPVPSASYAYAVGAAGTAAGAGGSGAAGGAGGAGGIWAEAEF